jgi:hypothetical protein
VHTLSGKRSWTMTINTVFLVLWFVLQIANAFGFSSYQPPTEAIVIAPAIIAIINLLLRYWRSSEAIAR